MNNEPLVGGGKLVQVHGGSGVAVEGVTAARRGLVVSSVYSVNWQYRLTQRAVQGTDLWRVVRVRVTPEQQGAL